MTDTRATTAKLAVGEDTISRATTKTLSNGTVTLRWSYRPLDGSNTVRSLSQGKTAGQARLRAREKIAEIEAATGGSDWKPSSDLSDYIQKVSKPAITKANLAELSVTRYELALRLLVGDCNEHNHRHSLARHTISSGTRFKALEQLLDEISSLHGRETSRQARTVLTKYVLTKLTRDELIDGNPIAGVSLDELTGTRKGERVRGGKALSLIEYENVLEYLLALDPAEGVLRRQGRWTLDHLVAKRRNTIDQALLQAATGLRSTEANLLTWGRHVSFKADGAMSVKVTENVAKGGIPRVALVLEDRVAQRMIERRARAQSEREHVIGSPANSMKPWDRDNRNRAAKDLYLQIAKDVRIPILENERSHVWRTTLHTLYGGSGVPTAVLDSQFGNSEEIRQKHYTDASDLTSLRLAVQQLRAS